jgi:hypothetical protein
MKKIILLSTLLVFLLTGCGLSVGLIGATKKMDRKTKKVEMGMTIDQFKKAVPNARRVYSDAESGRKYIKREGTYVYRLTINYAYVGNDMNRWQLIKDFGFQNNVLDEIGGDIEIRKR